jgi:hypothetical protein
MEENVARKGVCNKPLKYSYIVLEEGKKEMIPPYRSSSTLGVSRNQPVKHHHKLKIYGIVSLVCFRCKKMSHKDKNCGHSRRPKSREKHISITIDLIEIRRTNVRGFTQNVTSPF